MAGKTLGVAESEPTFDSLAVTGASTLTGALTVSGAAALNGNVAVGNATSDSVAFYGTTAVTQRAGAAQNTTALSTASSTAIDTATKAALIEIMDTMRVLGLWKGSA